MTPSGPSFTAVPPPAPFKPDPAMPRRDQLRAWLDSDPDIRTGLISLDPDLTALAARVEKWERLAVGLALQPAAEPAKPA